MRRGGGFYYRDGAYILMYITKEQQQEINELCFHCNVHVEKWDDFSYEGMRQRLHKKCYFKQLDEMMKKEYDKKMSHARHENS